MSVSNQVTELLLELKDVLDSNSSKQTCIWWRGRISGFYDALNADLSWAEVFQLEAALDELIDLEKTL